MGSQSMETSHDGPLQTRAEAAVLAEDEVKYFKFIAKKKYFYMVKFKVCHFINFSACKFKVMSIGWP